MGVKSDFKDDLQLESIAIHIPLRSNYFWNKIRKTFHTLESAGLILK